LNEVVAGGALAKIGAGAALAATSLSATSCVSETFTPPLATPSSTLRVSFTATELPFASSSRVPMWTSATSLIGTTTLEIFPASVAGIVTRTLSV
jgi:hypothetical protein